MDIRKSAVSQESRSNSDFQDIQNAKLILSTAEKRAKRKFRAEICINFVHSLSKYSGNQRKQRKCTTRRIQVSNPQKRH
ncbi:hypothetical protein L596_018692 [Steinernema carpocapsae]|uniref:Uncharacterized protein n=1 Tax=Steinernema carpocapsae TaxID=34508 RepID=A0A4U5N5V5_STECR|nr:hypothetical protein L596_018692 [Steinernema carpocapsae]